MLRISALVLAAACILAGCDKKSVSGPVARTTAPVTRGAYESFNREYVARIKELTAILKTAQDEASADAAARKLADMQEGFKQLMSRTAHLPMNGDQVAEFDKEFGVSAAVGEMRKEQARVRADPRLETASDAFDDLESVINPQKDD